MAEAGAASSSAPQHRPIFNLLLDAMNGVRISDQAHAADWASYDPDFDFVRGGEVELASVIGFYLHRASLQSPNLDAFFHESNSQAALEPLFQHFEYLQRLPPTAGIAAGLSAVYCYWRVEIELQPHPAQLSRWQGAEIKGWLIDILDRWRHGGVDDDSQKREIGELLHRMTREITARLRDCSQFISSCIIPRG